MSISSSVPFMTSLWTTTDRDVPMRHALAMTCDSTAWQQGWKGVRNAGITARTAITTQRATDLIKELIQKEDVGDKTEVQADSAVAAQEQKEAAVDVLRAWGATARWGNSGWLAHRPTACPPRDSRFCTLKVDSA